MNVLKLAQFLARPRISCLIRQRQREPAGAEQTGARRGALRKTQLTDEITARQAPARFRHIRSA
jgi:hypothetical protein